MRFRCKAETHPRNPQPFPGFQQPPGHSGAWSRSHWEDGARGQEDQARRGWPCQLDPSTGANPELCQTPRSPKIWPSHCQAHGPLPGLWGLCFFPCCPSLCPGDTLRSGNPATASQSPSINTQAHKVLPAAGKGI